MGGTAMNIGRPLCEAFDMWLSDPCYPQDKYRGIITRFPRCVNSHERANTQATPFFLHSATSRFFQHSSPISSFQLSSSSAAFTPTLCFFLVVEGGGGSHAKIPCKLQSRAPRTHVEQTVTIAPFECAAVCPIDSACDGENELAQPCPMPARPGRHAHAW